MSFNVSLELKNQLLTSFPNDNSKHIDYVIVFEKIDEQTTDSNNQEKFLVRKAFFEKLKEENFNIYEIETESESKTLIYCLLNCSKVN